MFTIKKIKKNICEKGANIISSATVFKTFLLQSYLISCHFNLNIINEIKCIIIYLSNN